MQYLQEIDWPKIKRRVVKSLEQNPHPWFMSQRLTRSLCLLQEILPWLSCSASLSVLILLEHTPFLKQLLQLPQFLEKKWFGLSMAKGCRRRQGTHPSFMQVLDHHSYHSFLMMYLLVCQFDE